MSVKYGYLTGEFEIDNTTDIMLEGYRVDSEGETVQINGIETSRDVTGLNVTIIGDSVEFKAWWFKYAPEK